MKKQFFLFAICFFAFANTKLVSQTLTLEAAISEALNKNLGIKVLQNDLAILKNNAVKNNAGFAPNINIIASETPSFGFLNQKSSNGIEVNRSNIANNLNGGVQLTWLLYDGKRMFLEFDRLKELQGIGEINFRLRTEQLVYDIMRAYYAIVRQQELYKSLGEQLNLYEERYRLAQLRLDAGKGNQLDVFQAQSDLSVQQTQLLRQKQSIDIAKSQLSLLMSNNTQTHRFDIIDTLVLSKTIDYTVLKNNLLSSNLNILLLKKQIGINIIVEKEIATLSKPRITFNSAFTVGRQDNTAGFFLFNQTTGLSAGLGLSYPIYDGGNVKRQVANAKLETASNTLRMTQLQTDLQNMLSILYQNYQNSLDILRGEENNAAIAKQSIFIAMERFRLSRSTILELAQMQQTYESAMFRAVNAKFDAKLFDIELLRLSGGLIR